MKRILQRTFIGLSLLLFLFIWLMGTLVSVTDHFQYYQNDPQLLTLSAATEILSTQARVWIKITDPIWFCETVKQIKTRRSTSTKVYFTDKFGKDIVFADLVGSYSCEQLQKKSADGTLSIIENPPMHILSVSQELAKNPPVRILSLCGHCDRRDNFVKIVFLAFVFPVSMVSIILYNIRLDKQKKKQIDNKT